MVAGNLDEIELVSRVATRNVPRSHPSHTNFQSFWEGRERGGRKGKGEGAGTSDTKSIFAGEERGGRGSGRREIHFRNIFCCDFLMFFVGV